MLDCPRGEVRDQLPALVNGTLDAGARAVVELHVAACELCRDEVALLRTLRAALLAQTPTVDTARIARAVLAARPAATAEAIIAPGRRTLPPAVWRVAAAVLIAAAGAFGYLAGRRPPVLGPGTSVAVRPERAPSAAPMQPRDPAPATTAPTIAAVPAPAPRAARTPPVAPTGLTFGGGLADLSDRQVNSLLNDLDGISTELDSEPEPVIDLGAAS